MSIGPLNSSAPTTSHVIGGVYNVTSPAPASGQVSPLQLDASGNLLVNIAAGGGAGGVQYADGTTQATPTGTVALGKNPSNILHALGLSAAGNLNVNLAEGTISGGNAAASPTGAAVPGSADYLGVNISGNLTGQTGFSLGSQVAASVAIVDGSGNQIISFGGGTQFADNAASGATPTGTLSMGWDSANSKVRALKVDASQNLNVKISGTVSVQGTGGGTPVGISGNVNQAIGVAGFEKITDGTNTAAVKAASTAAVATDPALVVAISPNNSVAVTGTFFQATQPVSIAAAVDVSDRAARLLGVVYGSQAQQLTQTATNFNLQTELATGGTLYDARQIRALTSADVVTAAQATAANLNATVNVNQVGGAVVTLGTKTSANSIPVVLASDQSTINVLVQNSFLGTLDAADGLTGAVVPTYASYIGFSSGGNTTGVSSASPLPVSQQGAVDVSDRSARLLGHVTVDNVSLAVTGTFFQATQPVSAVSFPLPTNAAQETGGNLASILSQDTLVVSNTRNDAQITDLLAQILAQAKYHNMLLASSSTADMDDADTIASTLTQ